MLPFCFVGIDQNSQPANVSSVASGEFLLPVKDNEAVSRTHTCLG